MEKRVLLLKFGELFLKGKNRREFLKLLKNNIMLKLKDFKCNLMETQGRLIICDYSLGDEDEIVKMFKWCLG